MRPLVLYIKDTIGQFLYGEDDSGVYKTEVYASVEPYSCLSYRLVPVLVLPLHYMSFTVKLLVHESFSLPEVSKADPKKALERFQRDNTPEEPEHVSEEDRPLTRRELEELLARHEQRLVVETQEDKLVKFSEEIAGTPQEAELVRAIHANRIFPTGMSLREQLEESYAIANVKRIAARNEELKRKIASQQTASRNTATTHRDPQAALEPDMAPDLKASMVRAGYAFNSTTRRYEKKLPNGKVLVKENGRPPYMVG